MRLRRPGPSAAKPGWLARACEAPTSQSGQGFYWRDTTALRATIVPWPASQP